MNASTDMATEPSPIELLEFSGKKRVPLILQAEMRYRATYKTVADFS